MGLHIHTAVGSGIAHCCRKSVDVQTQKDRNPRLCVRVPVDQRQLVPFSRFFRPVFFPDLRIPGQNPAFPRPRPVELVEFLCFNTLPCSSTTNSSAFADHARSALFPANSPPLRVRFYHPQRTFRPTPKSAKIRAAMQVSTRHTVTRTCPL